MTWFLTTFEYFTNDIVFYDQAAQKSVCAAAIETGAWIFYPNSRQRKTLWWLLEKSKLQRKDNSDDIHRGWTFGGLATTYFDGGVGDKTNANTVGYGE